MELTNSVLVWKGIRGRLGDHPNPPAESLYGDMGRGR